MRDRDKTVRRQAGDFPDWDNPEDEDEDWEDAPEGYYDDEDDIEAEDDEGDDGYIPGPGDPDYDLSEAAGYAGWEEPSRRGIVPQWAIVVFSIVLILAILIPLFFRP
jgi:hypothetical protein